MAKRENFDFSGGGMHPYPHLKLKSERFPRILATRDLSDESDEYFGAFLNRTSVRILIDFLNRTFRLRSCDLPIDGSFPVPCTQYFSRRCIAPCVSSLCDEREYDRHVELMRMFLRNDRENLRCRLSTSISNASDELDFETAARERDLLKGLETFWANPRWQVWLGDAVDIFQLGRSRDGIKIVLITQRGRKTLGKYVFDFEDLERKSTDALPDLMLQLYRHYAPRELRVSQDFPRRLALAESLSAKFGRPIKIKVVANGSLGVTSVRAIDRTRHEIELKQISRPEPVSRTIAKLRSQFGLASIPRSVDAYDVAHISSTKFVAARVSRVLGSGDTKFDYTLSDEISEPTALQRFIFDSLKSTVDSYPDLILIDGGKTQLNAALNAVSTFSERKFSIISAVKPAGRHSEISHFLKEDGSRIEFNAGNSAHVLLLSLRDEVHELANTVHRLSRDMGPFYELAAALPSLNAAQRQRMLKELGSIRRIAGLSENQLAAMFTPSTAASAARDLKDYREGNYRQIKPLIVPIRYDEPGGNAEDLRPILTNEPAV